METKKVMPPKEWGDKQHKFAFDLMMRVIKRDGRHDVLDSLNLLCGRVGAEAFYEYFEETAEGIPDDVKEIFKRAIRHIEYKQNYE